MTNEEIKKLVDQGRKYKEDMDSIEVKLDKIKATLKAEAKSRKADHFLGVKNFCRVGPLTTTVCNPEQALALFEETQRRDEFFECCKMLVGEVKSKLGETLLASISTTDSIPYKKVSFLAKPPKKYL
jgi:hypothetical protein